MAASLAVQWLRLRTSTTRGGVPSLVGELRFRMRQIDRQTDDRSQKNKLSTFALPENETVGGFLVLVNLR